MSLETGTYIITSPALNAGDAIAQDVHEDLSSLPTRVIILGQDVAPKPQWLVEKVDGNRYKLITGGKPTAVWDNKLYAIFLPDPPAEEWIITYRENHDAYTVENASRDGGWVADPEEDIQVAVRPLIVGQSLPPYFPSTELFRFIRVDLAEK